MESETKDTEESNSSESEEDEAIGSSTTNGRKPKAKVKGKKANMSWSKEKWALPK